MASHKVLGLLMFLIFVKRVVQELVEFEPMQITLNYGNPLVVRRIKTVRKVTYTYCMNDPGTEILPIDAVKRPLHLHNPKSYMRWVISNRRLNRAWEVYW